MEDISAVSALQDFCTKSRRSLPTYTFTIGREGGYTCKVTAVGMESSGDGHNKRVAKHLAAENIWRKIREKPGVNKEIEILDRDMMQELRAYCIRHGRPMPTVKMLQQSGSGNAKEFVVCCSVGSIERYGKAQTKKQARQLAAIEMLTLFSDHVPVVSTKPAGAAGKGTNEICQTCQKLKIPDHGSIKGVPLWDRHNFFKRYCPVLKEAAFEVIRSDNFASTKDKALSLLSALKLKPTIETVESTSKEAMLKAEMNCEFDCVFLGLESEIYGEIIDYFKTMLV